MSKDLDDEWAMQIFDCAVSLMEDAASRPEAYAREFAWLAEHADLAVGVWNEPGHAGLFTMGLKGDRFLDPEFTKDLDVGRIVAIPCRNVQEAIAYRVLHGEAKVIPDGRSWSLTPGRELRVRTMDQLFEKFWVN